MTTGSTTPSDCVYSVHTTRPQDVGAVEIVFGTESEARSYALDRSTDHRVQSASVTRFRIGELGTRHPVAFYVNGMEERQRFDRARLYPSDGSEPLSNGGKLR